MPLLQTEAAKLSNNVLEQGVIEEIITSDAMYSMLPFMHIMGKAYVYNREHSLSEADFLSPYDTVNEGAADFTEIVSQLKILVGDVDVDNFLEETQSDSNNQTAVQIAAKAKGMARKFQRALAQGDSSLDPKSFDGLPRLSDPANTLVANANGGNGEALTFARLDTLLRMVPLGCDALVMRGGTHDAVLASLRTLGGTRPDHIVLPQYSNVPIPVYRGIPILINDFLSGTEVMGTNPGTCSIYAVRFNEADGLHGIFGGPTAGVRMETVGTLQTKDAMRYRMKWYVGTVLKSTKSLARLQGIANV